MAKLQILAVYDVAVGAFMRPMFVPSKGVAVRSFQDEVGNKESPMNKHPEDYSLMFLGVYDEETGSFEDCPAMPERIVSASDFTLTH